MEFNPPVPHDEASPASVTSSSTAASEVSAPATPASLKTPAPAPFCLDKRAALPGPFPNGPVNGNRNLPATIPNVRYVLDGYDVKVRYNVINKKPHFEIPGIQLSADSGETAMTEIVSLMQMNGLPLGSAREFVMAIGDRNRFNPVSDWIRSKPWDPLTASVQSRMQSSSPATTPSLCATS